MFNEKEFIAKLTKYEIKNNIPYSKDEENAIVNYCEDEDDYSLNLAVYYGFVLGCMNAKKHIADLISNI